MDEKVVQDNDDFYKTERTIPLQIKVRVNVEILVVHTMFSTRVWKALGGKALRTTILQRN